MVQSLPVGLVWHSRQSSLRLPRQMEHVSLSTSHDHMNTGFHFLISNGDLPEGFTGSAAAASAAGAAAGAAAAGSAAGASVIAVGSVMVSREAETETRKGIGKRRATTRKTAQSVTHFQKNRNNHNCVFFFFSETPRKKKKER